MIISDINYLVEVDQETDNVIGGYGFSRFDFKKNVQTNVHNRLNVKKNVLARVWVKGNLADAEAYADAYGYNSLAETLTVTYADGYSSSAYSDAKSAAN